MVALPCAALGGEHADDESGPRTLGYQPALDGLRAVAVAGVLVYHHVGGFSDRLGQGGLLGVDVFFVLSGFLITSLLLTEHRTTGRIHFAGFWLRRARRLLPALLAALLFALVLGYLVYSPRDQAELRDDVYFTLGYIQNWHIVFWNGPIDSPFAHAWSLSVEEQFYLVWPLVLAGLLAFTRRRRALLGWVILGLAVVGAIWTVYRYSVGHSPAYFGTDTRAQELLLGAAFACLPLEWVRGRRDRALDLLGLALLAGLVALFLFVGLSSAWYSGGFFVFGIGVVVVIAAAIRPDGVTRRVLSVRPLVAIGTISYGLYLYHFPIYHWITPEALGLSASPLFAVRLAVTTVVAVISYRLLEAPIRRGRGSTKLLVPAGIVAVALVLGATVGMADAVAGPRSDLLAYSLPPLVRATPAGTTRVLLVGGNEAALVSYVAKGAVRAGPVWGVALGTAGCGFTTPTHACQVLPSDLPAVARAFQTRAVVVLLDGKDLTGPRPARRVVAVLAATARRLPPRALVVVLPPCSRSTEAAYRAVEPAVRRWGARTHAPVVAAPGPGCGPAAARPRRAVEWFTRLRPDLRVGRPGT